MRSACCYWPPTLFFGGIGWLSVAGLALLAIFFWAHAQLGLAGWEGAALTLLGLVLLAVEALIVPGFGVAGLLGLAALLGGIFLAITGGVITPNELMRAGWMLLAIVTLLVAGLAVLTRALPQSRRLRGLVLRAKVGAPTKAAHRGASCAGSAAAASNCSNNRARQTPSDSRL